MPKAPKRPLSCLFAINKPTGQPSMTLLNKLQPLFASSQLFKDPLSAPLHDQGNRGKGKGRRSKWKDARVKMGQGGTLDPLADGVLVVGTNAATKHLAQFLDCTKEYRAIGLVGCSTDSYDSEGKRVRTTGWEGVTEAKVRDALEMFRGEIEQTPPIYSALKMDGKPLYEYARSGTPLPRPIPARKVTVSAIELVRFLPGEEHSYEFPKEELGEKERLEIERLEKMVKEGRVEVPSEDEVKKADEEQATAGPAPESSTALSPPLSLRWVRSLRSHALAPNAVSSADTAAPPRPPIFEIALTVSSGTYIRSIVHDLGLALGTTAHVVKLTRTRQGEFALNPAPASVPAPSSGPADEPAPTAIAEENPPGSADSVDGHGAGCVEWTLLASAIERLEQAKKDGKDGLEELERERDTEGWLEWEREVLRRCKEVQ
ncbi:hypothetical protein JCM1841_005693 [Sporobolomyces salmonicolor]